MAWETRGNGQKYFYLSEKLPGGRVRKHYLGNGFRAEIEAMRLEKVHADRAKLKHEIATFQEAEATAEAHFRMVDDLVSAIFVIAGYHNTRYRGWRRIKMIESEALEVQVDQPVKLDQPVEVNMERFSELVKAAKAGDRTVVPELRGILEVHPALREFEGNLSAITLNAWCHAMTGEDQYLNTCIAMDINRLRRELLSGGHGSAIESLVVEQVLMSYVQINNMDGKDATTAATNVQVAELRMRRHEAASKRHLKSLELLSKLRTIPLPVVSVENLTVVQAKAEEAEPDQTIVIGQKLHNRLEHAFENAGWN